MKICLIFESLLLKQALELFLREKTTTLWGCDIILADHPVKTDKPFFLVGSDANCDIRTPFTQAKLLIALQKIEKVIKPQIIYADPATDGNDIATQIKSLCDDFAQKLIELVKK